MMMRLTIMTWHRHSNTDLHFWLTGLQVVYILCPATAYIDFLVTFLTTNSVSVWQKDLPGPFARQCLALLAEDQACLQVAHQDHAEQRLLPGPQYRRPDQLPFRLSAAQVTLPADAGQVLLKEARAKYRYSAV